jgi:ABC-type sulfate transport system permease subunit
LFVNTVVTAFASVIVTVPALAKGVALIVAVIVAPTCAACVELTLVVADVPVTDTAPFELAYKVVVLAVGREID